MLKVLGMIERFTSDNKHAYIRVIAKVIEDKLVPIEDVIEEFPNRGNAFCFNVLPQSQVGDIAFYCLTESSNYNEHSYNSAKYAASIAHLDIRFLELRRVDFSFNQEKQKIISFLQNDFQVEEINTKELYLFSNDKYLIGPISIKFNNSRKWVGDFEVNNVIAVRKLHDNPIQVFERLQDEMRFFLTNYQLKNPIIDELDCATDERVIRDALKILKEEKGITEISRKVIKLLVDEVTSISVDTKKNRVNRAIYLLQERILDENLIGMFDEEIIQYPAAKRVIDKAIDRESQEAVRKIEEEHSKITNKTLELEKKKVLLETQLDQLKKGITNSESELQKAEKTLHRKLTEMQKNVYETMLNQLPSINLNSNGGTSTSLNSQWIIQDDENANEIDNLTLLLEKLIENIKRLNIESVEACLLAKTIFGAIIFRQPLIIKGAQSFELCQVIKWSLSAGNNSLTIFPDLQGYSNELLINSFNRFKGLEYLKTMHIANIENSSAELYISSFVDYWKLALDPIFPDLLLISIKNEDDVSGNLLNNLRFAPIINTDNLQIRCNLRKIRQKNEFTYHQFQMDFIEESEILVKKALEYQYFYDALLKLSLWDAKQIRYQYKDWFRLLDDGETFDEDVVTKWILETMVQPFVSHEDYYQLLEELDLDIKHAIVEER